MNARTLLLPLIAGTLLAGCTTLLPRDRAETPSPFRSYAEAQAAAEKIVPFQTDLGQLAALGFDPAGGTNVTYIPYPDILARLAPYSGVPREELDSGISACIAAKTACRAYVFRFEHQDRQREGNFAADFFNVRRVTHVTGWRFEALVVLRDSIVLFRNIAGEPNIDRVERRTNPLGPLQPAGEAAGSLLLH